MPLKRLQHRIQNGRAPRKHAGQLVVRYAAIPIAITRKTTKNPQVRRIKVADRVKHQPGLIDLCTIDVLGDQSQEPTKRVDLLARSLCRHAFQDGLNEVAQPLVDRRAPQ